MIKMTMVLDDSNKNLIDNKNVNDNNDDYD